MKRKKATKKDWWRKQCFVVTVDMFCTDVGFCIGTTAKEAKAWVKKVSGTKYKNLDYEQFDSWESEEKNEGRMVPFCGGFIVLLKADKRTQFRKFVGLLTHEVTHVVQYLLRDRRVPLSEDTEEVHAYLTEFLVSEALGKLY